MRKDANGRIFQNGQCNVLSVVRTPGALRCATTNRAYHIGKQRIFSDISCVVHQKRIGRPRHAEERPDRVGWNHHQHQALSSTTGACRATRLWADLASEWWPAGPVSGDESHAILAFVGGHGFRACRWVVREAGQLLAGSHLCLDMKALCFGQIRAWRATHRFTLLM